MRRLLLSFFMIGALISTVGCHCLHSHGVCDCDVDDYCTSRSPWIRCHHSEGSQPTEHYAETICPMPTPAPMLLPDAKKNGL